MTETDGLQLPVGLTEKQFMQQVARLEARMSKMEKANAEKFSRSNKQITQSFKDMDRNIGRHLDRITDASTRAAAGLKGLATSFAGGLVGGIGATMIGGFRRSMRDVLADVASIGDVADRVQIGTEALQGLQHGFRLAGFSANEFNAALTRFTRRIGEAVNGGGPLQTTLDRYRISIRNTNGEMKSQLDLMREVAEVIRRAPTDAEQLAIAQAAFGDVGRRMVNALRGGADGIDDMIRVAQDAGVVLDDEIIRKAEEIDRKFAELGERASAFSKRLIVGIALAGADLAGLRKELDRIFPNEAEGRAIFGDLYDALDGDETLLKAHTDSVRRIAEEFAGLKVSAHDAARQIENMNPVLVALGQTDAADEAQRLAQELRDTIAAFEKGDIEGQAFADRLADIQTDAAAVYDALGEVDRAYFDGVTSRLGNLGSAIAAVRDVALDTAEALAEMGAAGRVGVDASAMGPMQDYLARIRDFKAAEEERNSATSEQLRLQREVEATLKRAADAGVNLTASEVEAAAKAAIAADDARRAADREARSSGRGGSSSGSKSSKEKIGEFEREAKAIRDRAEALEIEAMVFAAVADSSVEYADALEFAAQKARLLAAAQKEGRQITPELEAEIDKLAQSYVTAGLNAEQAAERLERIKGATERGKDALERMFGSIIDGSASAKNAVAQLLAEIAKAQMMRGLMGLPGMGGLATRIGGWLGFAEGGYTGPGGKYEVAGPVHKGEFVFDQDSVRRAGGPAALEGMRQALKRPGYASGGYVGAPAMPRLPSIPAMGRAAASVPQAVNINVNVEGANGDQHVISLVQQGVSMGLRQYDRGLPDRIGQINSKPRWR